MSLEPPEEDAEDTALLGRTTFTWTRKGWTAWILVMWLAASLTWIWFRQGPKLKAGTQDFQEKQQLNPSGFTLGGTLVAGPGCPAVCGSFVACDLDRRSRNNLMPLQMIADTADPSGAQGPRPVAYDNSSGELSLPEGFREQMELIRLSNKQVVPRTPDFQCPETECFIPNAFVNDDFCDCPTSCADEAFHACDSCGVDLPPFSQETDVCPDLRCLDIVTGLIDRPRCVGLGSAVDPFLCPPVDDSNTPCTIDRSLVDNNQCDCPGTCADESSWTCQNCSCVNYCGVPPYECRADGEIFRCPETPGSNCSLPANLQNNGVCDCPETCADEDPIQNYEGQDFPVNCEVCQCPGACGQFLYFLSSIAQVNSNYQPPPEAGTCVYEQYLAQLPRFQCPPPGECSLPQSFVNDNVCDCPGTCADEEDWNCDTCTCPEVCGTKNRNCFDLHFPCPGSSCTINIFRVNDGSCDCPTCADEAHFTCETCNAGCPTELSCNSLHEYQCDPRAFFCPLTSDGTICSPFPASYVNDNVCDCPGCSDEQNWDCSNCSAGCTECRPWGPLSEYQVVRSQNTQRLVNCFGDALAPEFEVRCPGYPAQTPLPATPLGCSISFTSVNDNKCDCPTCRDEALEDCDDEICSSSIFCSPGGVNSLVCPCPSECGMPTDCTGKCIADPNPVLFILRDKPIPTIPPECLYFCPSGASCAKHVQVLNNSVCDCLDCEDEADWSCETCQCPITAPGYLDFPKVGCDFTPLDVVLQGKGDLDTVLNTKLAGTCSYPPPPGPVPLALTKDTLTKKMLERRDRKPTQSQQESAQWEELLNSALADDHIRKAMESATAQGYTRRSQEVVAAAVAQKFELELRPITKLGELVSSALDDINLRKVIENCAAEAYSDKSLQELRDFVRKRFLNQHLRKSSAEQREHHSETMSKMLPWAMQGKTPHWQGESQHLLNRRLQSPFDIFECPGSTCSVPPWYVNDRYCDCPGCEDEEAFTCDTCIPTEPFGTQMATDTQTDLGVAVGVGLGVAVGVGLGVGLGVSAAVGGAFAAVGFVQFTVSNAQDFATNPQVQQGLKNAFLRLAGLKLAADAVTLNWACAGEALAKFTSKLRRLGSEVRLCFEIQIEGEKESLEACEVLVGTSPATAAQVIQEELEASNVAEDIDIIRWSPEPNPLSSLHPNTQITQSGTRGHAFTPPSAVQFSPPATVNPGGAG